MRATDDGGVGIRNILRREQRVANGRREDPPAKREQRVRAAMRRVRRHRCPCGSRRRFGGCCLGKHRCRDCGASFALPDNGHAPRGRAVCPRCGSTRTVAMPLHEARR